MATLMATLSLLVSAGDLKRAANGDMTRLRGTWYLLWTADEWRTSPGSSRSRMEVGEGGRVAFKIDRVATNRGTITVGSSGKLRTIDLKLADGRTLLGVYELSEDELTACFAEAGEPRPAGVKPKGRTQWAERWKRERL